MKTAGAGIYSPDFYEFVRSTDRAYLGELNKSFVGKAESGTRTEVSTKTSSANFTVNKRNKKFHFGFGYREQYVVGLNDILHTYRYEIADAKLSTDSSAIDETIKFILDAHPDIIEIEPIVTETQTYRRFSRALFENHKDNWQFSFADNAVTVIKAQKPKAKRR